MPDRLLFSTRAYSYLAEALCRAGDFTLGEVERRAFPDGERYQRITSPCAACDVTLVGGTISDADTLELYDLACALVHYGASRLSLVIPYFGYSTMERAIHPGEVVTAKTRARLLSSIPAASLGNRVFVLDLHVDSITHYFEGNLQPVHVSGRPLLGAAVRRLGGGGTEYVLGCTDAGRAKWVESMAHYLGVDAAFVYKRRVAGDRTEVAGVSAHVRDKRVVIYDDMIRTGGSLLGAAAAYRAAGATDVTAVTTHGLFSRDGLDRIAESGLLRAVVASDSHPAALAAQAAAATSSRPGAAGLLTVDSVAPLLVAELGEAPR